MQQNIIYEGLFLEEHGYSDWYKLKKAKSKSKKTAQDSSTNNPNPALHVTRVSPEKGNFGLAFILAATNTWVIDSVSIDHMTSHSFLIDSLIPSHVKSVQIANGTPTSIS